MTFQEIIDAFKEEFHDCRVSDHPEYVMVQKVAFWCEPLIGYYDPVLPDRPSVKKITVSYAVGWQEAEIAVKNGDLWIIREQLDKGIRKEIDKAERAVKKEK